jgi:hypothetical protein
MLITLLAWLYISFLCGLWGTNILHLIKRITGNKQEPDLHFSVICLLGLAGITIFASILSLFIPLGTWLAQVMILLPCIFFLFYKTEKNLFSDLRRQFNSFHPAILFLSLSCIIMLLVMSSWTITHPDTLSYHAQTIQWIEKYKAIPGLVHLHIRYGYQGLWFVACAIFSFKFTGAEALTFINSTVLVWYFIFIVQKINENIFESTSKLNGFLWIALAAMSIWSYTQVRLTATSSSPDFIASLLVWTIFILLFEKKIQKEPMTQWILIILFSFFAITIKLSVLPVIIIAGFAAFKIIQRRKIMNFIAAVFIAVLIIGPFAARNIISSGYLVFPSTYPDIAEVDWKLDKAQTELEKNYITAYARTPVDHSNENINAVITMKLKEWLPLWWKNRSLSDRVFIILFVLSFITVLINFGKVLRSEENTKMALLTSLAGCIFWFMQAPDLRFGFGFIVAFPAVVIGLFLLKVWNIRIVSFKKILIITGITLGLIVSGYSFYRFEKFFRPRQLILPLGIKNAPFKTIQCGGIEINVPEQNKECGSIDIPCLYNSCQHLQLRGTRIEECFKAK